VFVQRTRILTIQTGGHVLVGYRIPSYAVSTHVWHVVGTVELVLDSCTSCITAGGRGEEGGRERKALVRILSVGVGSKGGGGGHGGNGQRKGGMRNSPCLCKHAVGIAQQPAAMGM
jgi:hypothetical protein